MKTMIKLMVGGVFAAGMALAHAEGVDVSNDGIFNTLSNSSDLQASVDKLLANGAKPQAVVSVAAAAGISLDSVKELQVCVNSSSSDAVLSASCMKQKSIVAAYNDGANDPMRYLPATAAGKRQKPQETSK